MKRERREKGRGGEKGNEGGRVGEEEGRERERRRERKGEKGRERERKGEKGRERERKGEKGRERERKGEKGREGCERGREGCERGREEGEIEVGGRKSERKREGKVCLYMYQKNTEVCHRPLLLPSLYLHHHHHHHQPLAPSIEMVFGLVMWREIFDPHLSLNTVTGRTMAVYWPLP